jgi:hypothetical protein
MHSRHWCPLAPYDSSRAAFLVSRFVLLLVLPALVLLHTPLVLAQTTSSADSADSQDAPPLTTAQEQARQLATALTGKGEATVFPENLPALGILADRTMHLGKRLVIPLFAWHGVEIRFVGGEQTFASPVDEAAATAPEEAGRPLFLPASQTAVGVEVTGASASGSPTPK